MSEHPPETAVLLAGWRDKQARASAERERQEVEDGRLARWQQAHHALLDTERDLKKELEQALSWERWAEEYTARLCAWASLWDESNVQEARQLPPLSPDEERPHPGMSDARELAIALITLAHRGDRQQVRGLLGQLREEHELRRLVLGVWLGGRLVDDLERARWARDAAPVVPATPLNGPEALPEPATAEEQVAAYLGPACSPTIEDAAKATGLTTHKIAKAAPWKDHEERILAEFLEKRTGADISDVMRQFGWSKAKISGMRAWKARMEKKAERPAPASKERRLDDRSLKGRSDGTFETAKRAQTARDEFWDKLLANADEHDVGLARRLKKLGSDERERLLVHCFALGSELKGTTEERQSAILLIAEQWLEDLEQNKRRAGKARPR